ncbi:hypothetical protein DFH09DRAFT_1300363 [Mycena vulgaris]|nr:hypothetical protein DFH09DRAFT_1300363 [Mycena vulgaris]
MSLFVEGRSVASFTFSGFPRTQISTAFSQTLINPNGHLLVTAVVPPQGSFSTASFLRLLLTMLFLVSTGPAKSESRSYLSGFVSTAPLMLGATSSTLPILCNVRSPLIICPQF